MQCILHVLTNGIYQSWIINLHKDFTKEVLINNCTVSSIGDFIVFFIYIYIDNSFLCNFYKKAKNLF